MQSSIQSHQYANAYEATQKRAHHRHDDALSSHYHKKRSYVCKSNFLANLSWLILHNHSMLKGLNFQDTLRTDTLSMIYPNFHENVCICGKVLIRWKIGIPFWKSSPAVWPVTSVLEFPLSTSTPPLIFHGHPVPDVVGEHDMQLLDILEDLIFYCMSNTWTDRVQFSCWCHDDSTIQCSGKRRDKDRGMRGRGWAEGSAKFHSTRRRPLRHCYTGI